jgi:hypothetical protein
LSIRENAGVSYPFYGCHLIPEFNASGDGISQTLMRTLIIMADFLPKLETLGRIQAEEPWYYSQHKTLFRQFNMSTDH